MTISSVVQNGFFQDGNQLIRIPPRSAEKVTAARRRARIARERSKKRMSDRSRLLWTSEEHERFLQALEMYPSGPWKLIANHVGTRSTRQAMTHAQKYRQKIERRKQKQLKLSADATSSMPDVDLLFPCSPTTVDTLHYNIPNDMVTLSSSEEQQPVASSSAADIDDDVERALTMEFLDEFQPLTMDCEEPLTDMSVVSGDESFWADIGAISACTATSTAPAPAVRWSAANRNLGNEFTRQKDILATEPRPLLELNVQQAIAGILQKPRWSVKWQDQEIRGKWWSEVELQLLLKTFDQSLAGWSHGREPIYNLNRLLQELDGTEKHDKLREWLKEVVTDFKKGDDEEEEEEEEESDDNDENITTKKRKRGEADATETKRLRTLEKQVESQESYPTVKWTFNHLLLHERLSAIRVEEWTDETIASAVDAARSVEDPILVPRAADFVLAVRRGVSVEEALPIPLGTNLLSADRVIKLKMHCEKIHQELVAVQNYISKYVESIAKRDKLAADLDPMKVVICPAGIDGVWISDNLIAKEVALKIKTEVEVLENVPEEEKDWHPRSKKQVLDLVHPSLFCCVYGQTLKTSNEPNPTTFTTVADQMHRLMFSGSELVKKPVNCNSAYQWIPSDFAVSEGGEAGQDDVSAVRILSYINNLHPEQFVDLYNSIGTIFGHFVPLFERVLSDEKQGMARSTFRVNMQCHDTSRELPPRPKIPTSVKLPKRPVEVSLRGKKLQVIVKIAEIVLTPEKPRYKGGAWHVEGTPVEDIVATGIYYFGCENIKNSRLSFRAEVEEPPYQQNDDDGVAEIYGLFGNSLLVQELGSIETSTSRCVVFSNALQHQVQPFELQDPTKAGFRKILAFFLVDPESSIPSTSVTPPQQQEWMKTPMEFTDVDTVKQNIRSMLPSGMSLAEAKQHRLKLMKERSVREPNEDDRYGDHRYFSLCEH